MQRSGIADPKDMRLFIADSSFPEEVDVALDFQCDIVMKTGTHPMRTRLQLFLNWGITFGEPYVVPERANRAVAYANRVDLERNLPQLSEPEEMVESRGYAVSSRGGIAHAPAQERAVKRGKQMKTFGEEER